MRLIFDKETLITDFHAVTIREEIGDNIKIKSFNQSILQLFNHKYFTR